jgi:hypothetical protein
VNAPLLLVHVTTPGRARSIAVQGLVPGGEDRCNYDCNRWMPLDGVYLSQSCNQVSGYRRAHGLADCGVVVVEADATLLLPDEDVIECLLAESLQDAMGVDWTEIRRRHEDDGMPHWTDPFWNGVRDSFERSCGPRSSFPLRDDDLDTLVEWWGDYEFFVEGGDIHPTEWAALKDRIVRAFPRMEGMSLEQKSKRHEGPIGFQGPVRILGVAVVENGDRSVLTGSVPDCGLVEAALGDDWWMSAGSDADSPVSCDDGADAPGEE